MASVLEPPLAALNTVAAVKRDELRLKKPRVYEKIRRFDAEAPNGVVVQAMLAARGAGAEKFLFAIRRK